MRGHARVALAIVFGVAIVTVLAVSLADEQRTAEDDTVLETTAPASQVVAGEQPLASFKRVPTGSFSRRRAKLGNQDATGKQFDKMFAQYFQNPSLDLEGKLKAAEAAAEPVPTVVGTMGAPTTKVVEVIKELQPVHKAPKPDAAQPPVVEVVNGKQYTVKKVISVQKMMPGAPVPPVQPVTIVTPAPDAAASLKGNVAPMHTPAVATTAPVPPKPELKPPKVAVPKPAPKAAAVPATVVPATVVPATVVPATVVPATVVPATVVPATVVPATVVPATVVPATVVPAVPSERHTAASQAPFVGRPVVLPPIDVSTEPVVGSRPFISKPLHAPVPALPTVVVAKAAPVVQAKPAPVKMKTASPVEKTLKTLDDSIKAWAEKVKGGGQAAAKSVAKSAVPVNAPVQTTGEAPGKHKIAVTADDGSFGLTPKDRSKTPKDGVWTDGDSDYSQNDEPWKADGKAWPPMALTQELDVEAEDDAAPWEANAKAAPWEEPSDTETMGLLQMAAHSCATRKAEQRKSCSHAKAVAAKDCEADNTCDHKQDFAHKFCDRTAKAAMKECFKDWQMAKSQ